MKKMTVKDILKETIKDLMKTKPLEAITVQDILTESNISRPTFYRHFYGKADLVEYVFKKELAEPFFWDYSKGLNTREIDFLTHLQANRTFYLNSLGNSDPGSFYHMWLQLAEESLYGFFFSSEEHAHIDDADMRFAAKYIAYAWVNMNIAWLKNPDMMSMEELERKLSFMMEFGMDGLRSRGALTDAAGRSDSSFG